MIAFVRERYRDAIVIVIVIESEVALKGGLLLADVNMLRNSDDTIDGAIRLL